MREFDNLKSMLNNVDEEIYKELKTVCTLNEIQDSDSFMEMLGGKVFIVEAFEEVPTFPEDLTPDLNAYLPSGEWALLYDATSNGGGHSWFIPREIEESFSIVPFKRLKSLRGDLHKIDRVSIVSGKVHYRYIPFPDGKPAEYNDFTMKHLTEAERNFIRFGMTPTERFPSDQMN